MGGKKTFTYKVVKDCAIKADVYRDVSHTTQPVILFVHSGALIGGSRCGLPIVIELLANAGYTVVSIDYRLAPETKLNGIYDPFCPIRHITAQYPPTILLHGDKDTDVPYEQSVAMAKKLAEHNVDYQLITLLGKGHNFDINLDDPDVAKAINSVFAFLKKYL